LIVKIDPYNFELYRFKVDAFFETQCTVWVKKSPLRFSGIFSKTIGNF